MLQLQRTNVRLPRRRGRCSSARGFAIWRMRCAFMASPCIQAALRCADESGAGCVLRRRALRRARGGAAADAGAGAQRPVDRHRPGRLHGAAAGVGGHPAHPAARRPGLRPHPRRRCYLRPAPGGAGAHMLHGPCAAVASRFNILADWVVRAFDGRVVSSSECIRSAFLGETPLGGACAKRLSE